MHSAMPMCNCIRDISEDNCRKDCTVFTVIHLYQYIPVTKVYPKNLQTRPVHEPKCPTAYTFVNGKGTGRQDWPMGPTRRQNRRAGRNLSSASFQRDEQVDGVLDPIAKPKTGNHYRRAAKKVTITSNM